MTEPVDRFEGLSIGLVGLGVMGSAMGQNLVSAGHRVVGYDTDANRRAAFAGRPVSSVTDVAESSDLVVLSLPTADALASVAAEMAASKRDGLVVIETGTFPLADKVAARDRLAGAGVELLDSPLSGTGLQATDATLVVLSSGDVVAHEQAMPVFDAIGRQTFHLGPFGNGSRMKFVANLLVAVHTLAAAEAHNFGAACGLDPAVVQEVVASGAGGSTMFDIRGPMMVAGRFDPPAARLSIILKDAGIISAEAREVGAATPLLDSALGFYEAGVAAGLGDLDAAVLHQLLRDGETSGSS